MPRREAVFDLWFSEAPDLARFDEFGLQAHAVQFFLELPEQRNFALRSSGLPELDHPFVMVLSGEVETGPRAVARLVTAGGPHQWGPIVAIADIQQLRRRISFRLPLSIFDSGDVKPYESNNLFAVHYFLQALRHGRTTYAWPPGVATVGTEDAPLEVRHQELRTGNGSKRRVVIARLLTVPSSDENPGNHFDAAFVDVGSVRFGSNRARPFGNQLKDVNGDGIDDLVLMFNAADVGLSCIDTDVRITGEIPPPGDFIPEGTAFIGRDVLSPRPCESSR